MTTINATSLFKQKQNKDFLTLYKEVAGLVRQKEYEWFNESCMEKEWAKKSMKTIFKGELEKYLIFIHEISEKYNVCLDKENIAFEDEKWKNFSSLKHSLTKLVYER